jgi:hypothetical protein
VSVGGKRPSIRMLAGLKERASPRLVEMSR